MKKILLGLGSLGAVLTPISVVISCGGGGTGGTGTKNGGTGTKNGGTGKDDSVKQLPLTTAIKNKIGDSKEKPLNFTNPAWIHQIIKLKPTELKVDKDKNYYYKLNGSLKKDLIVKKGADGFYNHKILDKSFKSNSPYVFIFDKSKPEVEGVFPFKDIQLVNQAINDYLDVMKTKFDFSDDREILDAFLDKFKNSAGLNALNSIITKMPALIKKPKYGPSTKYHFINFEKLNTKFTKYKFKKVTSLSNKNHLAPRIIMVGEDLLKEDMSYNYSDTKVEDLKSSDLGKDKVVGFKYDSRNNLKGIFIIPTPTPLPGESDDSPINLIKNDEIKEFGKLKDTDLRHDGENYHYKVKGTLTKTGDAYTFTRVDGANSTVGTFPETDLSKVKSAVSEFAKTLPGKNYDTFVEAYNDFFEKFKGLSSRSKLISGIKRLKKTEELDDEQKPKFKTYNLPIDEIASKFPDYEFKFLKAKTGEVSVIISGDGLFEGNETFNQTEGSVLKSDDASLQNKMIAFRFEQENVFKSFLESISIKEKPAKKVQQKMKKEDIYGAFGDGINYSGRRKLAAGFVTKNISGTKTEVANDPNEYNHRITYKVTVDQLKSLSSELSYKVVVSIDGTIIVVPLYAGRNLDDKLANYIGLKNLEASDVPAGKTIEVILSSNSDNGPYNTIVSIEIK